LGIAVVSGYGVFSDTIACAGNAMFEDIRREQMASGRKVVSRPPRKPAVHNAAAAYD
jgi:hypothetical protein